MSQLSVLRKHLALLALIAGTLWLFTSLGVGCPILWLTGFPCPTCGTTRALLALLRLDFHGYLFYQPFAVPLIAAVVLCIHGRLLVGPWKCAAAVCSGVILCANTLRYVSILFLLVSA